MHIEILKHHPHIFLGASTEHKLAVKHVVIIAFWSNTETSIHNR